MVIDYITLTLKESKVTLLLEMACCYGSFLEEREGEAGKYEKLTADLALQFPSNKVRAVPLVIGDLGCIGGLAKSLHSTTLKEGNATLCSMHTRMLYSSTRILKRQLAG